MSDKVYNLIRSCIDDPYDVPEPCWWNNETNDMTLEQVQESKERMDAIYGHTHQYEIVEVKK